MSFSIARDGDRVVLSIVGQLVVDNRQELKRRVVDELERGTRTFLLDFRQTGYIDSSGLGALVSIAKHIRQQAGELRLANLNDELKTLFELSRLDALFQIDDDDGPAGRPAPILPRRPGPLEGTAAAEWPDASPPA